MACCYVLYVANETSQMFETLFKQIENALDTHPVLERDALAVKYNLGSPEFRICRLGFTVVVRAHKRGSRKKPSEISGTGDTAELAVAHLIDGLDHWAEVL